MKWFKKWLKYHILIVFTFKMSLISKESLYFWAVLRLHLLLDIELIGQKLLSISANGLFMSSIDCHFNSSYLTSLLSLISIILLFSLQSFSKSMSETIDWNEVTDSPLTQSYSLHSYKSWSKAGLLLWSTLHRNGCQTVIPHKTKHLLTEVKGSIIWLQFERTSLDFHLRPE